MTSVSPALMPSPSSASLIEETRRTASVPAKPAAAENGSGEESSFSFADFLSIINPLQHLPVIGTLYRAITGDTIKPASRVLGGALFGGPVGLLSSAFNAIVEQATGNDLGDKALALVLPDRNAPRPEPAVQYAAAGAPPVTAEGAPEASAKSASSEAAVSPSTRDAPAAAVASDPTGPSITPFVTGDRAHGISMLGRGRIPAKAVPGTGGRTLADYRTYAGHAMPVVDNTRSSGTLNATPIRLQTTTPVGVDGIRAPILPATPAKDMLRPTEDRPPGRNDARGAAGETAAAEPPPDAFVAAMLRGLDRYREMKQGKPTPAVIDATL